MRIGKGMIIGLGLGLVLAGLVPVAIMSMTPAGPSKTALQGENFYAIRREALTLFPRGSRLKDAAEQLTAIGFRCNGIPHKLANINAESLICASNGRGAVTSPALNLTVFSRNGLISDFEVWNMLARADSSTPAPPPPKTPEAEYGETKAAEGEAKAGHGG